MKHNKKRNTAFLYEALTKELAKCKVKGRKKREKKIEEILKRFFSKGKILNKDLELYQSIDDTTGVMPHIAEKILSEAKKRKNKLDNKKVYKEQSRLLNEIDKQLSKSVYSNFISNYKSLATICQILTSEGLKTSQQILLEEKLTRSMVNKRQKKQQKDEMEPLSRLAYLKFVEKFNKKYGEENLISEQRELLSKYIYSMGDNEGDFQYYIGQELKRLKSKLDEAIKNSQDLQEDPSMKEKTQEVLEELKSYSNKSDLEKEEIRKIMKTQELVKEFEDEQ